MNGVGPVQAVLGICVGVWGVPDEGMPVGICIIGDLVVDFVANEVGSKVAGYTVDNCGDVVYENDHSRSEAIVLGTRLVVNLFGAIPGIAECIALGTTVVGL